MESNVEYTDKYLAKFCFFVVVFFILIVKEEVNICTENEIL